MYRYAQGWTEPLGYWENYSLATCRVELYGPINHVVIVVNKPIHYLFFGLDIDLQNKYNYYFVFCNYG